MLKILIVSHSDAIIGGATTSLIYLVRSLIGKGCDIKIACNHNEVAEYLGRRSGAEVTVWGHQPTYYGKVLSGWSQVQSFKALLMFLTQLISVPFFVIRQIILMKKERPDLVHLNSSVLFHSAVASKLLGIPLVWHIREGGKRTFRRKISGQFIQMLADAVICISPLEKSAFFLDGCSHAHIVFNPVDFNFFDYQKYDKNIERKQLGYSDDDFVVLSLGGVNPRKGPLEILQALPYLSSNIQFLFAGPPLPSGENTSTNGHFSGAYNEKLLQQITKFSNRVQSLGDVENIAPIIASCDILVFGGMVPHFPRPVYEAWIMRKVPVAFDCEGMEENIVHEVDGIIVEDLSGQELATAIENLANDSDLYNRMSSIGYDKARLRMDPQKGADKVLKIYRELTGENSI